MTIPEQCPICRGIAPLEPAFRTFTADYDRSNQTYRIECSRCGDFLVHKNFCIDHPQGIPAAQGILVSGVLRTKGKAAQDIVVSDGNLDQLAQEADIPSSPAEYFDRLLQIFADHCLYPGMPSKVLQIAVLAARLYVPEQGCNEIRRELLAQGLLKETFRSPTHVAVVLTSEGWKRLSAVAKDRRGTRPFVAMWFDETMQAAYTNGIAPALIASGYSPPFRVDDPEHDANVDSKDHISRIDNRILAEIRQARFLIADVTGQRQSVYYEAGFADGLGIPIIWCCRKDEEQKMSFDTRQIAHILWEDAADLKQQLIDKIGRHGWRLNQ